MARLFCRACIHARTVPPVDASDRQRAIFDLADKWISGTELTYSFLDGRKEYRDAVRRGFEEWQRWAAITFREVPKAGQIRIAFNPAAGSWSYIGRGILRVSGGSPTMNIGWSPLADPDLALHEIGHTLALYHEHQNAGIDWNRKAVIEDLSGPPNYWTVQVIEQNVLNPIPKTRVVGSDIFDPDSIMMYPIPARWIHSGPYAETGIQPSPGLSPADKYWAGLIYPRLDDEFTEPVAPVDRDSIEVDLTLSRGEQARIRFEVLSEGEYEMGTTGSVDTVCVLFADGTQVAADDDSGTDLNALIKAELKPDVQYELVTRLYSRWSAGDATIYVKRK